MSEIFEKIFSYENLYKAHRVARLGKRHKKEVIEFELNLSKNIWELFYDIKYGRYVVDGYHKFMIYDPKEREIQAISYRDRIVQHCLCDNYLTPQLDRKLIYDNSACRKKKGVHFALKRVRYFMCEHYKKHGNSGYFVKIDVKKYFASIDHEILKAKLKKIIADEKILGLLNKIIDSYNSDLNKGLPMGNQTSQSFALLYLNDLDHFIKEKLQVKFYERYMDDMLLVVKDKKSARICLMKIYKELKSVNLIPNAKSQIIAIKNGINFLGWRLFFIRNGKILQKILSNSKKRILGKSYSSRQESAIKKRQILASYKGHLKYGNANNLFLQIKRNINHKI